MNKNKKSGTIAQRIGTLIEQEICKNLNLTMNKRQRTFPFYDAYDKNGVYEIKAGSEDYKRFVILKNNHKNLCGAEGSYIFVGYTKTQKDKNLIVSDEIHITTTKTVQASSIDLALAKPLRIDNTMSVRINFSDVGL